MSTAVDERPPANERRRRTWWIWLEVAGLVLVVLVSLPFITSLSGPSANEEFATIAAQAIEKVSPAEHHNHGHEVTAEDKVICGVHVFGTDPPDADSPDQLKRIYGYYFCAVGIPGTKYEESSRSDGPVVVTIGQPNVVTIAAPGLGYDTRVREMMPDQYEDLCFHGLPDRAVAAEVKRRFLADVTG